MYHEHKCYGYSAANERALFYIAPALKRARYAYQPEKCRNRIRRTRNRIHAKLAQIPRERRKAANIIGWQHYYKANQHKRANQHTEYLRQSAYAFKPLYSRIRHRNSYPKRNAFILRRGEHAPLECDAVIVDEAQDFSPQIWKLIPRLVGPYGHFYVFYDPAQNIFRDELHLPDFGLPPIRLTRNCRNTQKIIQALQPLSELPLQPMPHTPTGSDVIVRHGSDGRQLLLEELDRLVKVERVNYSDIVILAGHSLAHTCLGDQPTLGNYTIVEQPKAGLPGGSIRFYTYMKFKGCEASIIILLDVDADDPRWNDTGLYTAMSRAMHQLIILRKD